MSKTNETTGEMALMMKFYLCWHNFSELYFRQLLIALIASRKSLKNFNILEIIILVHEFCPLITDITRLGFRLKLIRISQREVVVLVIFEASRRSFCDC